MSDTPRTDKAELIITCDDSRCDTYAHTSDGIEHIGRVVRGDEMAQLERDLATAQARIATLESLVTAGMDLETKLHNECQKNERLQGKVKELQEQIKGMREPDKQKIMNEITEYCILAMYSIGKGMPKCETALDIEAFKQKARNEYLGISDNLLDVTSNLFHCQVKQLVYSIHQAVFGQPKQEAR